MIRFFKKKKVELPKVEEVIFFNLYDLILASFVDIICEGKLEKVVKHGKPTEQEIIDHWDSLFLQYSDIVGQTEYEATVEAGKELAALDAKIDVVGGALKVLSRVYVEELAKKLKEDYDLNINYYEEEDKYFKQFKRIEGRLKMWKVDYDILCLKNPQIGEGKKVSRETFDTMRVELSSFMGYPVRENETYTNEFALMIKRLNQHNESVERQMKLKKAS